MPPKKSDPPPVAAPLSKPPKGHKQKGAGTVIVARPPIETEDGIVLKMHERLPTVLLNEYCQREKRPKPIYNPEGRGQFSVVLPDKKNSKDDLRFCPAQCVESRAKDFAALLALYHFQKSLPLERTLPEPFSSTWTAMVSAGKADDAAARRGKRGETKPLIAAGNITEVIKAPPLSSATPLPATSAAPVPASGVAKGVVSAAAPKTASTTAVPNGDWLCDQCGNLNYATLASGLPRTKCFKCQASKSTASTAVASAVAGASESRPKKAPPTAVLDLRSKTAFVSLSDKERADTTKRVEKRQRSSYFDALRRSNRPMPLILNPKMRKLLESALGMSSSGVVAIEDEDEEVFETRLSEIYSDLECEDVEFVSSIDGPNSSEQLELAKDLVGYLMRTGFSLGATLNCLESLLVGEATVEFEKRWLKLDSIEKKSPGKVFPLLREAALQYMCRHIDEEDLPDGFDPSTNEGRVGFSIHVSSNFHDAVETSQYSAQERLMASDLATFGWDVDLCLLVMVRAKQLIQSCCQDTYYDSVSLLYLCTAHLLSKFTAVQQISVENRSLNGCQAAMKKSEEDICEFLKKWQGRCSETATASETEEECDTLEAIFGSSFERMTLSKYLEDIVSIPHGEGVRIENILVLVISSSSLQAPNKLLVFLECTGLYPEYSPLYLLRGSTSRRLHEIQVQLLAKSQSLKGESSVFQVHSHLEELLLTPKKDLTAKYMTAFNQELKELVRKIDESTTIVEGDPVGDCSSRPDGADSDSDITNAAQEPESTTTSSAPAYFSIAKSKSGFWSPSNNSGGSSRISAYISPPDILRTRQSLPAWASKEEFMKILAKNRAVVVTGETGCGKTTQIPQFIHESDLQAKIVVCQPRRLAAVGVAGRVAEEMDSRIGGAVGYMVRGDSKASAETRIVFCTYGVLLRRLQADPTLAAIKYLILDEVHERGLESDFSLALLLSAMTLRKDLKLIVMSATISTQKFSMYLGNALGMKSVSMNVMLEQSVDSVETPVVGAPVLFIPGFTYPVDEYYRGDYEDSVAALEEEAVYGEDSWMYVKRKGELDYGLLVKLLLTLVKGTAGNSAVLHRASGAILVFMPGLQEITRVINMIQSKLGGKEPTVNGKVIKLMALHGALAPSEQRKIFRPAAEHEIKIVVSTNVAEASVTIPDCTVVIDSCRVKEIGFDVETQMSSLLTKFASQDSMRQRRGRAGRVQKGRCFRLITVNTFGKLPPHGVPEMLRVPLDNLILQIASMPLRESCSTVLAKCPDPPEAAAIESSIASLTYIQALKRCTVGDMQPNSFQLTALGRHLAELPCSPKIGRLLIYGSLLGCTAPCAAIAASINSKSPFLSNADEAIRCTVIAAKKRYCRRIGKESDQLAIAEACREFRAMLTSKCGIRDLKNYCNDNGLSFDTISEILSLQRDLLGSLASIGFIDDVQSGLNENHQSNANSRKAKILSAALCAGFYPQLVKVVKPPKKFVEIIGGAFEKSVDSRDLKLYIPEKPDSGFDPKIVTDDNISTDGLQRVFMHPSSVNFNVNSFANSFLVYGDRQFTSKPFVRDTTEVNAFPIVFFGGALVPNYESGIVTIDGWLRFSAPGKIVALVEALRLALDSLLDRKIEDPCLDVYSSPALNAAIKLISTDGLLS